jgi:hypothetical protein
MKHNNRLQTVDSGLLTRWEMTISDGEHHWQGLHVVHVMTGNLLKLFEGMGAELKAWSNLRAIQFAVFHVAFGIKDQSEIGRHMEV